MSNAQLAKDYPIGAKFWVPVIFEHPDGKRDLAEVRGYTTKNRVLMEFADGSVEQVPAESLFVVRSKVTWDKY